LLLSVCIPTHTGRAAFVAQALDSVLSQLEGELADRVEVCISDNASTDATAEVVEDYGRRFPGVIAYHRNERDIGLVPNLVAVVERARGTFCWLLGSDDTLEPGSLNAVVEVLARHPELAGMTVNRVRVDDRLPGARLTDPPEELPEDPERQHLYTSADQIFRNCALSQDFMSTQVVNRQMWREIVDGVNSSMVTRTILGHALIIGLMVRRWPRWMWHPMPFVVNRTGTSTLTEALEDDYAAYARNIMEERSIVWGELFGDQRSVYRAVMKKTWRRTANPFILKEYKIQRSRRLTDDLGLLADLVGHFWFLPEFWLKSFPLLLVPSSVALATRGALMDLQAAARRRSRVETR